MMKLKTIMREANRILKPGGRISLVVEPSIGAFGFIDFPHDLTLAAKEIGMVPVGKVYLPRRADAGKVRARILAEGMKSLASECRELLTFEKPA